MTEYFWATYSVVNLVTFGNDWQLSIWLSIHINHVYIKLYIAQSILSPVHQLNLHPRCLIKVVKFFDKMWDPSCQAHLDRNPPTEFGIAFPCQKVLSMQKLDIWVDSIHTFIYVKYSTEFDVWPIDRSYYCILYRRVKYQNQKPQVEMCSLTLILFNEN